MRFKTMWKTLYEKRVIIPFGLFLTGIIVFSGFYFIFYKNGSSIAWKQSLSENHHENTSTVFFPYNNYLDGRGVLTEGEKRPIVIGVMIDNSPDVPSQSGLSQAKVVYEALAEGGITRYFALFEKDQIVDSVGPVRSARMYYLDWLQEYGDALYLHVGGSPEALSFLKRSDIFDINEFGWGKYFWRSSQRVPPHNVFTNSKNWQEIYEKYGKGRSVVAWEGWKFGEVSATTSFEQSHQALLVPYFSSYKILWNYNPSSTVYERLVNGKIDKDSEGNLITSDNVIVQFVSTKVVDEVGRRDLKTTGSGEVVVARKGLLARGTWKKETVKSRTKFFDSQGKEIVLTPGKTWIQVVPASTVLEITN